ncbi:MAG TPA: phosphonopyruvate decarboxylase [Nevskia sp.]|nr:phosphonopyruvate decarboxylase [Nevskia sp.]
MIEAAAFVEAARQQGFSFYAGVPCSFLTPFINYVIQDHSLRYLSCANEGDAVAVVAGQAAAGMRGIAMMQNSGLGNAVSPLTSLTWTFRLPLLLIITWRGEPGVHDEPQHQLMGPITPQMLDTMEIPWEIFPQQPQEIEAALQRATRYMEREKRPYALLMKKGTVAEYPLRGSGAPQPRAAGKLRTRATDAAHRPSRAEALRRIIAHTPLHGSVVLATTGFTGRELYALDDRPNQLYMVGSMGCVSGMALGLALARPDLRVVAVDGDGAALMRMGLFATLGTYGPANLVHLLLDNGVHDSTGGQATVSAGLSFAAIAAACGYPLALESDSVEVIDELFQAEDVAGPRFAHLRTRPGAAPNLPRPLVTPEQVGARLAAHIIGAPA